MICSKEIIEFYEAAENYVLGCSDNLNLVKGLYLESIKNDNEEADKFVSSLPNIDYVPYFSL